MRKSAWIAACAGLLMGALGLPGAAKPVDAEKGKALFGDNCEVCHNSDSTEAKIGPGLKGLFKRQALANKKKVNDENVLEMIEKGSPAGMPPFADQLTEQEKADILAYLKTL